MKRAFQFAHVRNGGINSAGRFLVLSAARPIEVGAEPTPTQVGIIVTKRVGNAVTRNRLRRKIREIYREHAQPIASGYYLVIILRQRAEQASYQELQRDFVKAIPRLLRQLEKERS